jgi:hypothetical protein
MTIQNTIGDAFGSSVIVRIDYKTHGLHGTLGGIIAQTEIA